MYFSIKKSSHFFNLVLAFLLVLSCFHSSKAQTYEFGAEFFGFADNREYKSDYQIPQTMFGFHAIPKLTFCFDTIHNLHFGTNLIKEFGSEPFIDKAYPYIYYNFKGEPFNFIFGSFPRAKVLANSPNIIYYDSLNYYRPYVSGLFWTYKKGSFSQSVYLDWTSRKAPDVRETFIMGGQGKYQRDMFFVHNYIYMYHYANQMVPDTTDPVRVRDNGVAYLRLGLDFSEQTILDSLSISASGIMSFERRRGLEDWQIPKGLIIEFTAEFKGFGINNILYMGDGHNLDWGDPYYRLKRYNRVDFYYKLINSKRATAQFAASMHFAENKVSLQQQFTLLVDMSIKRPIKPPLND